MDPDFARGTGQQERPLGNGLHHLHYAVHYICAWEVRQGLKGRGRMTARTRLLLHLMGVQKSHLSFIESVCMVLYNEQVPEAGDAQTEMAYCIGLESAPK